MSGIVAGSILLDGTSNSLPGVESLGGSSAVAAGNRGAEWASVGGEAISSRMRAGTKRRRSWNFSLLAAAIQ